MDSLGSFVVEERFLVLEENELRGSEGGHRAE